MPQAQARTHIITTDPGVVATTAPVSALLRLLHLASPALPIGAFHFSQGLEFAVDAGWVRDEAGAREWIGGIAGAGLATLDLPVLHRLHDAWSGQDPAAVARWNAFLIASRETAELRLEDRHLGDALLRVLAEIGVQAQEVPALRSGAPGVAYATAYAFACARWKISPLETLQSYAWAWLENNVLAAVKLIPLGQSAGQRLLHSQLAALDSYSSRALRLLDSDIGVATSLQAVASARHETLYSRLFRS